MDATHLHLALAHLPIVGTIIGIAILVYGLIIKNMALQKVAFTIFVAMTLLSIPVYLAGEDTEEAVEHLSGVSEQLINEHEELAETAIWLMGVLGALSIIAAYTLARKLSFAKIIVFTGLILSLVTFGVFAQLANLGGQIRHSEIRGEQSLVQEQKVNTYLDKREADWEDDD